MKGLLFAILSALILSFHGYSQSTSIVLNAINDGTTFNTCLGGLFDSGGQTSAVDYSNNEDYAVTICPSLAVDKISLVWTTFSLNCTDNIPGPLTDADHITIYDGNDITAPMLGTYYCGDLSIGDFAIASVTNLTGCLTVVFSSNATGTGSFTAQVSCDPPCDPPFANGIIINSDSPTGDSIAVCAGEDVTFGDNGSTSSNPLFTIEKWVWHWKDGTNNDTLLTASTVDHAFQEAGEYIVQLEVIDGNECSNSNATDIKVFVSTIPSFDPFPNDTSLCIGQVLNLTASPNDYEVEWSGFPARFWNENNCMEDLTGIVQSTPLLITGYDPAISLSNAFPDIEEICVDIEHSFMGDFLLQVQCPTGQIMTLHEQAGGGIPLGEPVTGLIDCNDPLTFGVPYHYCFTADATETWEMASSSFTVLPPGDYLPVDVNGFGALDGCPVNGTWNLLFTDLWGSDDGSLPGWSIDFADYLAPPATSFTPDIGAQSDSSYWDLSGSFISANTADRNEITIEPTTAGTYIYNYEVINDFGCTFDKDITVIVEEPVMLNAGLDSIICEGSTVQLGTNDKINIGCAYVLELIDLFGDGWNDNTIDVWINGALTTYTLPKGNDFRSIDIRATQGDLIEFEFKKTGTFSSECEIRFYDPEGNEIYTDGVGIVEPTLTKQAWTADCFGVIEIMWTPNDGSLDDSQIYRANSTPLGTTVYDLTVWPLGAPECATSDDVRISIVEGLNAGEDGEVLFCFEDSPEDLFQYLLGAPQFGGEWYNSDGMLIGMPFNPATMLTGIYEYRRDSLNCSVSAYVNVSVLELRADITVTHADCGECNGETQITPLSGTAPYEYSNDAGVTFVATDNFVGLCGAATVYDYLVRDDNGCSTTLNAAVKDTNFPVINDITVLNASCNEACDGSILVDSDFAEDFAITNNVTGLASTEKSGAFNGLCAGEYKLVINNNFGCKDSSVFVVGEPSLIGITSLTPDTWICSGESITLAAVGSGGTGSYTYNWESAGLSLGTGSELTLTPNNDMRICVILKEDCPSLQDTACMNIEVLDLIEPVIDSDTVTGCYPLMVNFNNLNAATGIKSTEWIFGDGGSFINTGSSDVVHTYNNSGSFDVSILLTTDSGCVFQTVYGNYIEVFDHPKALFNYSPFQATVFNPEFIFTDLSSADVVDWSWDFSNSGMPSVSDAQNPLVVYPEGVVGNYPVSLFVVNENGCKDSISAIVSVINEVIIYAPNVFTPNGDRHNQTWGIFIEGIDADDFHLTLFNRWGEQVWESFNANEQWDGSSGNTSLVQDGTYIWVVTAKDSYSEIKYEFNGHVTLLK